MSAVDERVVRMEFDNKQFEKNIQESMKSLDDFDKQLGNLEDNDSFDSIEKGAKKVDFSHLLGGIDKVSEGFNALEVIAIGALANIGGKLADIATQYAGMFTIKQIGAGWQKFADYSSATLTTIAATAGTWKSEADSLERINKLTEIYGDSQRAEMINSAFEAYSDGSATLRELSKQTHITQKDLSAMFGELSKVETELSQEEFVEKAIKQLNWYSDETSYNFTDMISTLGKFTGAGQELMKSTDAIQGMMNMVAVAGGNAEVGQRVAYNLSQAMGAGALKMVDWKSLQNANVATVAFKEALLETASAYGTITKQTDKYGHSVYKLGDDIISATSGFEASLQEGWITADVLQGTLEKYGAFTTALYKTTEAYGVTASDTLKYIDQYREALKAGEGSEEMLEWTREMEKAFAGDQEAIKGFQEALVELGSEEMEFSRKAFEEAQAAKTFKDAIEATADAVSTKWMNIFKYMFGSSERAKQFWSNFTLTLYDIFAAPLDDLLEVFEKVRTECPILVEDTGEVVDAFELFRRGLDNLQAALLSIITPIREAFKETFLSNAAENIANLSMSFAEFTESLILGDTAAGKLKDALSVVFSILQGVGKVIGGLFRIIRPIFGIVGPIVRLIGTIVSKIFSLIGAIREAFDLDVGSTVDNLADTVGRAVDWLADKIDSLSEWIDKNIDFEGLVKVVKIVRDAFVEAWKFIKKGASDAWAYISPYLPTFEEIEAFFVAIWDTVKGFLPTWEQVVTALQAGWEWFVKIADVIWKFLKPYIDQVAAAFGKFWGKLSEFIVGFVQAEDKFGYLRDHILGVVNAFLEWKRNSNFLKWIISKFETIKQFVIEIKDSIKNMGKEGNGINAGQAFGIFYLISSLVALFAILKQTSKITTAFKNISTAVKKFSKTLNKVVLFVGLYLVVKAITALIDVLTEFCKLDIGQIAIGVTAVVVLGAALLGFAAIMKEITAKMSESEVKNFRKITTTLAIALIAIAGSLWIVSQANSDQLGWKVLALVVMLGAIVAACYALSISVKEIKINTIATLIVLAAVLLAAAFAIQKIGQLNDKEFEKARTIILIIGGIALAAMAVGSLLKNGSEAMRNIAIAVGAMAASLLIIVIAMEQLKKVQLDLGMVGTLLAILAMLGIMAAIPVYMGKFAKNNNMSSKDMLKTAATVDLMAVAILLIAGSMALIAKTMAKNNISSTDMLKVAGVLAIITVALGVMAVLLAKATSILKDADKQSNAMKKSAKAVQSMVISILLIAAAMVALVKLDISFKESLDALAILGLIALGLAAVAAALAGATRLAGKNKEGNSNLSSGPIIAMVLGIVALVAALLILSKALEKDGNKIQEALVTMGWIAGGLAALILVYGIAEKLAGGKLQIAPLIVIMVGVIAIMHMLILMSAMDSDSMKQASISLGIVIGALALLLVAVGVLQKLSSSTGNTIRSVVMIAALVAAVIGVAYALKQLEGIDEIVKIALTLGILMAALGVVFGLLGSMGVATLFGAALILAIGAALILLAEAAKLTAAVLPSLSEGVTLLSDAIAGISFSWEQLGKLAVALLELSVLGVPAMIGVSVAGLILAAAFVVLSVGLAIVSGILPELSIGILMLGMSMNAITGDTVKQGLMLVAVFLELMAGGIALGIGLAAAGAGLLVVGVAALTIAGSIAITALAVSELVKSLALLAQGIALVADVFKGGNLSAQVSGFAESVKQGSSDLTTSIKEISSAVSGEGGSALFDGLFDASNMNIDISGIKNMLSGSLTGEGGLFGGDMSSMLSGDFSNMLSNGIGGIDMSSIDISSFTSSLGDTFTGGIDGVDFSGIMGESFMTDMGGMDFTSLLSGAGFSGNVTEGISNSATDVDTQPASDTVATNFADGMVSSSNLAKVDASGKTLGEAAASGIESTSQSSYNAGASVASQGAYGADSNYNSFYNAGSNAGTGFVNGIYANLYGATVAGQNLAVAAYNAAMNYLQERSPSKLFMKVGGYVSEGFAIGIGEKTDYAVESVRDMALETIGTATEIIASTIENDYCNPVIRPTLDLSNVTAGASRIGSMFGSHVIGVNGQFADGSNYNSASTAVGTVNNYFTINAQPNQSVDAIANAVERKLNMSYYQRKAAGLS